MSLPGTAGLRSGMLRRTPSREDHTDGVPTLVVLRLIHEVADEEETAASGGAQVLGFRRVGYGGRIESVALVADADDHPFAIEGDLHPNRLRGVALVSIEDRVGEGLGNTDAEVEIECWSLE